MHIARVDGLAPVTVWALVDPERCTARHIRNEFEIWAPHLAGGDPSVLDLAQNTVPLSRLNLRAPHHPGGRIFGVGMNYLEHLNRLNRETPPHTIAYIKPDSAILDPGSAVEYPAVTNMLDFEIELVAVVARPLGNETHTSSCLLGYTIGNDISARDAGKQLGMTDLFTQKALDRTAPIGPWIATLDIFGGPGQPNADMEMRINGEVRQHDNSRNMIFKMDEILNFIDARVRLKAGDMIFTGSTSGVGLEDGRFLQPGDHLEAQIQHIGVLRHTIGVRRTLPTNRSRGKLGIPLVDTT